jgi:uncharacterized phage-associated protein
MNNESELASLVQLIKGILSEAENQGISVGRVRLVKLLYLLEIEYYRIYQKRLTHLKWEFYHYGPYPRGIEEVLCLQDFEEEKISLSEDRVFRKLKHAVSEPKVVYSETGIERLVKRIINEWGGFDLRYLLDYVYFETEPMIGAKTGDVLDFSKVKPWHESKIKDVRIKDRKKFGELKKKVGDYMKNLPGPEGLKFKIDKAFLEGLRIWNEDASQVKIKGNVEIE